MRNLTSVTRPDGAITRYGYFPDGKLTTWERDLQGRITAKVYADASRQTYAYEPGTARLKSRTDALASAPTTPTRRTIA